MMSDYPHDPHNTPDARDPLATSTTNNPPAVGRVAVADWILVIMWTNGIENTITTDNDADLADTMRRIFAAMADQIHSATITRRK